MKHPLFYIGYVADRALGFLLRDRGAPHPTQNTRPGRSRRSQPYFVRRYHPDYGSGMTWKVYGTDESEIARRMILISTPREIGR